MKKTLAIILALVMSLSLLGAFSVSAAEVYDGTSVSASLSGAGTEADPYLIANGADLAFFAANPVDGACYKLTNDIVWSSYTKGGEAPAANNWTAIKSFNGTFDGDGHSISGLYIKETASSTTAAFFAKATGTIKNLTIKDSYFEAAKYVSAFVGQLSPSETKEAKPSLTIDNCVNYADICVNKKSSLIGGIIGDALGNARTPTYLALTITNCVNYGTVSSTASGTVYIAGIVGRAFGEPFVIDNCANFGDIISIGAVSGGVVGQAGIGEYGKEGDTPGFTATITNCYNMGNVSAKRICGGIIGRAYPGTTVSNCVNLGNATITANDASSDGYNDQFGPITGHGPDTRAEAATYVNFGTITNCFTISDAVMSNTGDTEAKPFFAYLATVKTAAELNSEAMVTALGEAWTIDNGKLTLKFLVVEPEAPETTEPAPETTEPAPETTEPAPETTEPAPETTEPGSSTPTGDSAVIFAVIAVISVLGVAVVAKKREN